MRDSSAAALVADPVEPQEVMSVDDVAAFLGCDRKTVYEAVGRGHIPHRRLGRRVFFLRSALLEWLSCKGSSGRR